MYLPTYLPIYPSACLSIYLCIYVGNMLGLQTAVIVEPLYRTLSISERGPTLLLVNGSSHKLCRMPVLQVHARRRLHIPYVARMYACRTVCVMAYNMSKYIRIHIYIHIYIHMYIDTYIHT